MGTILDWPSWDEYLANIQALLWMTASWLLSTGWGHYVLLLVLIMLVLWAVAVIHGNVKADDSFNIRSDAKAMADWYKERV